ncbi:MAG: hypothetical protein JSW66_07285 [Phycisphaerales bacterium]|nr:MAG: hypothetical protein JSW66_07285 [Phycisphaerales bacterium]
MAEPSANPILEQSVRLSQSMLWDTQRAFYASGRSIQAWQKGIVPQYITSNPFIAASYARVISAFIDDCHSATNVCLTASTSHNQSIAQTSE